MVIWRASTTRSIGCCCCLLSTIRLWSLPIAIVAILTIYHNLQYHRLIWFHNQKYRSCEKYGAAEFISRRLAYYVACGILFGVIYQGPRQLLGYVGLQSAHPPLMVQFGGS